MTKIPNFFFRFGEKAEESVAKTILWWIGTFAVVGTGMWLISRLG